MRLHRRQAAIEAARSERRDLVEGAGGEHGVEAGVDAAIELGAIGIEKDLDRAGGIERGLHALPMPVGERPPGRQNDLQRAGDAGAIARHQPVRGQRIAAHQLGIERGDALGREPRAHRRADVGGDRRNGGKPARERLEVEPSAADDDRHAPCPLRLGECHARIDAPAADRIILGGVHVAVKEMRLARLVGRRRTRGDDAQIAIDLHGIGVDDGTAEPRRQRKRERRLAARGRSGDEDCVGSAHGPELGAGLRQNQPWRRRWVRIARGAHPAGY